jgi:hypothetical protein
MKISRRGAMGLLASSAASISTEAEAFRPQTPRDAYGGNQPIELRWLSGAPPLDAGVSWGVPFARGTVAKGDSFTLTAAGGEQLPLQSWPLAYWPDGSIKFGGFATVAPARTNGPLALARGDALSSGTAVQVRQNGDAIEIDTGRLRCVIAKRGPDLIQSMEMEGRQVTAKARLLCSLEDRSHLAAGVLRFSEFAGEVRNAAAEQSGPVRATVKLEGIHKAVQGNREWLPFTVRLYFYAGLAQVRLVHSIVFDGDQERDFIRGLGVVFEVPLREQVQNRHVRFSGEGDGVWSEPLQPATGRRFLFLPGEEPHRPFTPQSFEHLHSVYADQLAGKRIPNKEAFNAAGQKLLTDWAVWDSYKLVQFTPDGFTLQKRTNPESCWLDVIAGQRASGLAFIGDVSGGLGAGVKDFWQSYPTALEIRNGATSAANLYVWLWSPDVPAMDLRHYDTKAHDLDSSYEDVQPGFSTPHGVGRTSEITLFPSTAVPEREHTAWQARMSSEPPLLVASPEHIHAARVFGIWSLPDRSTPAKEQMENKLNAAFSLYAKEVDQRDWYGYWNYGDVMHTYDGPRHEWRYDIGGFAWDNTELGSVMWLWYTFLRTGGAKAFRMAEAMTRHTSEVDVYHLGRFDKLGSRHNVRHWGDGAKEMRISQAAYHRFYYYLTTDERIGDRMRAVVDADYKLIEIDPMREASPRTSPMPYPARIRGGPDWLACVANWMTEWERTGGTKYRDKIIAGMDSIAVMPYGFLTGPDNLYGYDPKTGKLYPLVKDGFGTYNLATIMGGAEVIFELNELIEHPAWRKIWLQYCRLVHAPKDIVARDMANGTEGSDAQYARSARLAAYVYRETNNVAFAGKAWSEIRVPAYETVHLEGPAVLKPIDEVPRVSTNSVAQSSLEAIEILEMCGGQIPENGV